MRYYYDKYKKCSTDYRANIFFNDKFMKELEIDWIRKTNSSSTYVGRGYSKEKIEMESFDFYNCF